MKDLVERLKDLEYSADDVFMASAIQEAIQEIERLHQRIDAAMAWLKSDEEHDDEFELLRILSGEEPS